jgi:hypothetical protein
MLAQAKTTIIFWIFPERFCPSKHRNSDFIWNYSNFVKGYETFFILEKEKSKTSESFFDSLNVKILTLDGKLGWIFIRKRDLTIL